MAGGIRHATALVESDQVGEGTNVWAYAHVMKGAVVGRDCNVGDHAFIESGAVVTGTLKFEREVDLYVGAGVQLPPIEGVQPQRFSL